MKLSHLASASLALVAFLAPASAAYAQATYPPTAGNGQVDDTSVRPGECVTFSGTGYLPGTPVEISDNTTTVTTVNAGPDGSFSVEVCPRVLGLHILRGEGTGTTGEDRVLSAAVNVLGAGLSDTGTNTVPMVAVGAGLVVAGASAVVVASRRRRQTITA